MLDTGVANNSRTPYNDDISYILLSVCQLFEDLSDNWWVNQIMLREILDERASATTILSLNGTACLSSISVFTRLLH